MHCTYCGAYISYDNTSGCYRCAELEDQAVREHEEWERDRPARIRDGEQCPNCGTTDAGDIEYCYKESNDYFYCANCGEDWDKDHPDAHPEGKPQT